MIHHLPDELMAIPYRKDIPFSRLTTLGIGGNCRWLFEPILETQAQTFVRTCTKEGIPWLIIGSGSNIVVLEDIEIPVLRLRFKQDLCRNRMEIKAPANYSYSKLSATAADMELSGIEYAIGIPGTVGGAICMNAGAHGKELINILVKYRFLTADGSLIEKVPETNEFGYRWSIFHNNLVALGLTVRLVKGNPVKIRELMNSNLNQRRKCQPLNKRNAGCIFKNPLGYNAGQLIDEAGLKGLRIGDAGVSVEHANFLVNYGCASSTQFSELIATVQTKVKEIHGIILEPEVKIWKAL